MIIERMEDGRTSRKLRLKTVVRLRWLAVAGQSLTIFVIGGVLNFPLPIVVCVGLIALLAGVNAWLQLRFSPTHRLQSPTALALLGFDLLQLFALLFVTGGLANPFAPLVCVPVIIASASLPLRFSLSLGGLAIGCVTALAFSPFTLPWYPGSVVYIDPVMLTGIWFAIVCTTGFAGFYAYRVSLEASQLSDALTATELILQREKHLSQLDGLAAAAAHELGTPLATIAVVAKEMQRELQPADRLAEDVGLLVSQSERCRDILRRLTTLSFESEEHMRTLPLSSLIEEVTAPHREFGITIDVIEKDPRPTEPVGTRNAGIVYGLGNLIENAVDYAATTVTVTIEHNADSVVLTIEDDGDGFAPDVLMRIGDPYVTKRSQNTKAGGLGLGLFIAKTLLERSGAELTFTNRQDPKPGGKLGARVEVKWPREMMETNRERATYML